MISSPAPAYQPTARYVRSSRDPSRFYLVALNPRGYWECECPAATFYRSRPCKHVAAVVKSGVGLVAQPKHRPAPATVTTSESFRDFAAALEV